MNAQTRSTMTLTQAEDALKNLTLSDAYRAMSAQEKYNRINAIALGTSIEATGSTTVLYSGSVNGVSANDVVVEMYDAGEDIRIINNTDAAKFLTSGEI